MTLEEGKSCFNEPYYREKERWVDEAVEKDFLRYVVDVDFGSRR